MSPDEAVAAAVAAGEDQADLPALLGRLHRLLPAPGDPQDVAAMLALLRLLHAVGRRDLPAGRLFEGHVDALGIVARHAGAERAQRAGAAGALGVWNAALPGEPLVLRAGMLSGGKGFASGAGILAHALVTADGADGPQLVLVDLRAAPPAIDRGWWRVTGMARSETHLVRWAGVPVPDAWLIGRPGDYAREPWFSGGALRFVAVQAGGVAGLFDRARAHLVAAGRAGDPFQAARLAELFNLADLAAASVRAAAHAWFDDAPARLARVAAARLAVADLAERAIAVTQAAVGVQAMFVAHPLSAALTDLSTYLRQPAPDAQRLRVGEAVAAGVLAPRL